MPISDIGWVEFDEADRVALGDRLLPREMTAHFPSDATSPGLVIHLAVVDGVPQCRGLALTSKPGGREVLTGDVRAISLETWVEDLFAVVSLRVVSTDGGVVTAVSEDGGDDKARAARIRDAARVVQRARAAARRSITPSMLEQVAEVYRKNIDGRPTDAVRRAFGVEHRTAAKYVQRAREAGLLPPTTRGRARA